MKYLSKIFSLFAVGLLMASCNEDIEGGDVYTPLTVTTPTVTSVRAETAVVSAQGYGSHIIRRGFCYGTTSNPTIDGKKVTVNKKDMQVILPWLDKNTTYYVRTFVQTSNEIIYSSEVSFTTANSAVDDSDDEEQTVGPEALQRVSVHDPSIVWDPTSNIYYVFGSHRAAAKSTNMMTWEAFTAPWQTATSTNASNNEAFTTPQITKFTKGGQEYELNFDALAWSQRGNANYSIDGNMWAPDVVYNKAMQKWCMYLSINGDFWYSSIIMLTADQITGPYRYQAPIVMSGFYAGDAYKSTDLEIALGSLSALPSRYDTSTNGGWNWGRRYPNCIDPCVFYDEDGKLWMTYGSWSGGIWMLELDENTGLRDYNVEYPLTGSGDGITVDPYFGKKIAGGYYASGEASYIEYIGGYYYLFITNGGLESKGGYQMRVFRSMNPDGPYVDCKNASAVLDNYYLNFGPGENDGNRGVNILGAYGDWGYQTVGDWSERAQGHNSAIAAYDGRAYLVYHSRFQNRDEGHELRVHQLFQNEDAWLVAAPFEYTGEVTKTSKIAKKQYVATDSIPGNYKLLIHKYGLDHENGAYAQPTEITLNADGTISGSSTGTWAVQAGTSYITINIGSEYKGVMVMQTLEPKTIKTPAFTALDSNTGVTIWGYKYE